MKGIKEAFIDAGEISRMLGIGMTKAYAIIKEYNAELEAKGYFIAVVKVHGVFSSHRG